MEGIITAKRGFLLGVLAIGAITLFAIGGNLLETNNAGYYQVKQAFYTGSMTVRNTPGTYAQMLGTITEYPISTTVEFTNEGTGAQAAEDRGSVRISPLAVTFLGNSTAQVSGSIKYKLPRDQPTQLQLHETYRSSDAIAETLIRQSLAEVVKLAGPLFTPEEARTTRRGEYAQLVRSMLNEGLYKTISQMTFVTDDQGRKRQVQVTKLKLDEEGNRIIIKKSPLDTFGIQIVQLVIRGFDFDKVTDDLMKAKKEAEQKKVLALADAEKAKQDAITEEEKGKARVAKAKADKLVEKIQAVTDAQKLFEVAQYEKKAAEEKAQAEEIRGRATAKVAQLKVAAGLTPLEQATIQKETRIGIAEAWSKRPVPQFVVAGGSGGSGGAINGLDILGYQAMQKMIDGMEKSNRTQTYTKKK